MGHNVGEAAKRSTAKGDRQAQVERTPEQVLADLGKNAGAGLYVPSADILMLLGLYRSLQQTIEGFTHFTFPNGSIVNMLDAEDILASLVPVELYQELQTKNQEFRDVYEEENRSKLVTIVTDADTTTIGAGVGPAIEL